MVAQERFSFVVVGKHAQMVQNIMRGDRFDTRTRCDGAQTQGAQGLC